MPFERSVTDLERGVKVCSGCKQEKQLGEFYTSKTRGGGGYFARCKACCSADTKAARAAAGPAERDRRAALQRDWRRRNQSKRRAYERHRGWRRHFGLTPEDYDALLQVQGGHCAICPYVPAEGEVLPVDHDHETGAVRGLLCADCNNGLGRFRDDPVRLQQAISYLHEPPARQVLTAH